MAEAAGVSYNSVRAWEIGKVTPQLGTLLHLADVLCLCSLDELFGGTVGLTVMREREGSPLAGHAG